MKIGDLVWYQDKRAIVVGFHRKNGYTLLVFNDDKGEWDYMNTHETLESRRRVQEANIFEPLDKVWFTENNIRSIGIVTGFERGMYSVFIYGNHIWRRVNAYQNQLEHRLDDEFDSILFENRKQLIQKSEDWIKWEIG